MQWKVSRSTRIGPSGYELVDEKNVCYATVMPANVYDMAKPLQWYWEVFPSGLSQKSWNNHIGSSIPCGTSAEAQQRASIMLDFALQTGFFQEPT